MNTKYSVIACSALVLAAGTLVVAGPLSPVAGPVASTYKTLNEVEPRIAISSANTPGDANSVYRISNPGSYYLTGNVVGQIGKDAVILIAADNVTLDLGGYTIVCTETPPQSVAQYGVNSGVVKGATVRNGKIAFAGTSHIAMSNSVGTRIEGIYGFSASEGAISVGAGATVVDCTVIQAGSQGINAEQGSVIRNCTVQGTGDNGITVTRGVIDGCSVTGAGAYGFSLGEGSTVTSSTASGCNYGFGAVSKSRFVNCVATGSTNNGIVAGFGGVVEGSTANNNGVDGILANDDAVVRNCTASDNTGHGINADNRAVIIGNSANKNGAANAGTTSGGIYVAGTDCRVEGNSVMGNDWGIRVNAAGSFIVRNTASSNTTTNYTTVTNNFWGPVVSAAASAANSGNSGFGGLGNTDPNANFSY